MDKPASVRHGKEPRMAASNKWLMSSFAYYLDFFTVPLLVALALWLGPVQFWQIAAGVLIWSFVEYAMHRFLFHSLYRREHWTHHVDVLALIGISSWKTTATFIGLLLLAQALGLASLLAGVMLGYLAYIGLHYVMHRPEHWFYRFIPGLIANHDLHHQRGVEQNFGVSSPLWDHVFGTYVSVQQDELAERMES
jgi:sterol desaturase/sphingolipid hydroxylase (fatty acid hydroxylase superfamily)